jgi:D-alanine-D-alanine ligase
VILKYGAEHNAYSYWNKENWRGRVQYHLVTDTIGEKAKGVALAAWRGLGCRDAGRVDLRADAEGTPNFLEVNPLAGLCPGHSDLPILCALAGMTYLQLIEKIMHSALKRTNSSSPRIHSTSTLMKNKLLLNVQPAI